MKLEYLLFNLFVFIGPLMVLIFYRKAIKLRLKPAILSISIPAILFIIWDIIVTGYFWNFNPKYIIGIKLWTIPFEEALFFITVPFACLFLYVNFIEKFKNNKLLELRAINISIIVLLVASLVFLFFGKYYTFTVLCLLGFIWFVDHRLLKTNLLGRYVFWKFMSVVLILTFCFNYYLTSRPVVLYNNALNSNLKILTIPIEDFVYSVCLISLVLIFYDFFDFRQTKRLNQKA